MSPVYIPQRRIWVSVIKHSNQQIKPQIPRRSQHQYLDFIAPMCEPISIAALAVGAATLGIQGVSTAMQSRQMKRDKQKLSAIANNTQQQASNGLVPYGGIQQSTPYLQPYGPTPTQSQYSIPAPSLPDIKPQGSLDSKTSFEEHPGWTTVHKIETIYHVPNGSKLEPTHSHQSSQISSMPSSPLPPSVPSSPLHAASPFSTPPHTPQPHHQQLYQPQQPQQWAPVQVGSYIPGQGQITGFWSPAAQPMAQSPPPPYQQEVNAPSRRRDRLFHPLRH
jgi:hypothetical protein